MKYDTKSRISGLFAIMLMAYLPWAAHAQMPQSMLRKFATQSNFSSQVPLPLPTDPKKIELGQALFEEKALSLDGTISCRQCHIDRFGSADGLPNGIGIGGVGEGLERSESGGQIVPRNVLPLWGRGSPGFETLFWDGRVQKVDGLVTSQFGKDAPNNDPLVVAAHLPFVEINEMVDRNLREVEEYKTETVESANQIYDLLTKRILQTSSYARQLSEVYGLSESDITFEHIAEAIASFIRSEFRMRPTRFTEFLGGAETLDPEEIEGGLVFFGKGRCAICHTGPYFTDFKFYAIAFPQVGSGKNGFGVDYGRFNVTQNPVDLYKFRTPPLINVTLTAPYGHSGSIYTIADAIRAHVDPLSIVDSRRMDDFARHEFYKKLVISSENIKMFSYVDDSDIQKLMKFLRTLEHIKDR